jgi:hypothetical protein
MDGKILFSFRNYTNFQKVFIARPPAGKTEVFSGKLTKCKEGCTNPTKFSIYVQCFNLPSASLWSGPVNEKMFSLFSNIVFIPWLN